MIKITKAGQKMLDASFGNKGEKSLQILHIKSACNACRDELRLVPGTLGPTDEIIVEEGYVFFIDKELMKRAKGVTIDAAGTIPVLFPHRSIDPLEQ